MVLDHAAVQGLVPHQGAMCLIDAVVRWDAPSLECEAAPVDVHHPLAREGRVPALAASEYAAQAAAVHGALLDGSSRPRAGMLASLIDVDLPLEFIPENARLNIRASRLGSVDAGCLYAFEVNAGTALVARGRLMVAFTESLA